MNGDSKVAVLPTLTDAEAQNLLLAGMLEQGEAWKCEKCSEINGNHNVRCWSCLQWPD